MCGGVGFLFIYLFWVCFDVWRRGFRETIKTFFFSFFFLHLMIWAFLVADRTEKRRGRKRKQLGVPLLFLYMFFLFLVVA